MASTAGSMLSARRTLVFLSCFCCFHPTLLIAQGDENRLPWEGDFFTATPDAVLSGVVDSEDLESDRDYYILVDERTHIDKGHRRQRTWRTVYQIHSREDMEERGSVSAAWAPWIGEKPVIRARVITPDGAEHFLDQSTIAESAGSNLQDQMFLDQKVLSAPLPAVCVGAVVETEVITKEHRPFCPAGIVGEIPTERLTKSRRVYTELSADESIDLRLACVGKSVPLEMETGEGRKIWRLDQESPEPIKAIWPFLPKDVPFVSYVTYCTGTSWQSVAAYYHDLVEQQIKDASLANIVGEIKNKNVERREKVRLACRQVFDMIRYTGVEFGLSKIQPRSPAQTLQRRYGDCKDQAGLLIAMLRELDIEAYAALLNVSNRMDVVVNTPGLNAFDHVIVYVPAQDELSEIWIDMTSPYSVFGNLPRSSQNRLALVASPKTDSLKRTPNSTSQDNRRVQTYHYQLSADAPTHVVVNSTSIGTIADDYKATYASAPKADLLENAEQNFKELYGLTEMQRFDYVDCTDTSNPNFTLDVEFDADRIMVEEDGRLVVNLHPGAGFNGLPYEFVSPQIEPASFADDDEPRRTQPFVLPSSYSSRTSYTISPPDGFEAESLPNDHEFRVGTFHVSVQCQLHDDGAIQVDVSLDTGNGQLTPDQADTFRDEFLIITGDQGPEDWLVPVSFYYSPRRLIDEGRMVEGLRQMVETSKQHPESLFNRGQLASSLVAVGLGEEAREIALKMVQDAPESARSHRAVGWTHMHDAGGADLHYGIDRERAIGAYQKAIQLDDVDTLSRYNYAVLLEHDALGTRYSDPAELQKASDAYQWFHKMYPWETAVMNHSVVLAHLRDKRQLRRLTATYPDLLAILPPLAALEVIDRGVRAGDRMLSRSGDPDKAVLRSRVVALLRSLQEYDLMREYVDSFPEVKASAGKVNSIRRYEDVKIDASKPESVVQEFLASYLESGQDIESLRRFYLNSESDADFYEQIRSIPIFFSSIRSLSRRAYGRKQVARDIVSFYQYDVEGNDQHGYVVTATGADDPGLAAFRQYVVRRGDRYGLLCPGTNSCEIGKLAIKLIDDGDVEAGRVWLDRVYGFEKSMLRLLDPFAGTPFARIRSYCANDDAKTLRLAAVCLASRDGADEKWMQELNSVRESAGSLQQLQIDRVKARLLESAGRDEESLALVTGLLKGYPKFVELLMTKYQCEVNLERLDEAAVTLSLVAEIDQGFASFYRRRLIHAQGGHEAVFEYLEKMNSENGQPVNGDAMVWRSLFIGKSDQVLAQAKQSVQNCSPDDPRRSAVLHTLACVYAETGQLKLAADTLRATIAARNGVRDGIDDLALGRIAEHCGLKEAAKKYYRRVDDSLIDAPNDASCRKLAELRLQILATP